MSPEVPEFGLGLIEGFYGRRWTADDRLETIRKIAELGYRYFVYAPKGDACLRRSWADTWSASETAQIKKMSIELERASMTWGAGLSPLGLLGEFRGSKRQQFRDKIRYLDDFGAGLLVLLFDDMQREFTDMAERQAEIVHEALAASNARHLLVCPSYYSTDPVLETVFGAMPEGYIETFGALLPEQAGVFWTGSKVCSSDYDPQELHEISARFGRPLALWDNYPVNDGARMSRFMHIGPFTGRPASLRDQLCAHFVNPMNQCRASDIPLATLAAIYRDGDRYDPDSAWSEAAKRYLGREGAAWLAEVRPLLQSVGLDGLDAEQTRRLRDGAHRFNSAIAREILDWLDGGYAFDPACLTD